MVSAEDWAREQWAEAPLGDERLVRRAVAMGRKMAAHPEASLPNQMENPAALKGAYRLLNDKAVTLENLTQRHREQTLRQARDQALVLMVEDTTELNYNHQPSKTGMGPGGNGVGHALLLHSTLAVVPEGRSVLGIAHLQVVRRQPKTRTHHGWAGTPESQVWEVSAQQVGPPPAGRCWVHVSDRGSDIFEYLAACRAQEKAFLVRAKHNRSGQRLPGTEAAPAGEVHSFDYARSWTAYPGSAYCVMVPAHEGHPAREAQVVMQWAPLQLPPPEAAPAAIRALPPLTVWLLRVWEPAAPAEVEPVEWLLWSSLPILTLADARQRVAWYTCRWVCEDYHMCLKTGCQIERSQLDDGDDIQRLLGFLAPIAVHLLQLRQAARQTPQVLATTLVDPLLVHLLATRQHLEAARMTAEQFWKQVARLGGHQGRKSDGPPGWRTVWRGWRYLADLAEGVRLFASTETG